MTASKRHIDPFGGRDGSYLESSRGLPPETSSYLAALRDWAMNPTGDDRSNWEIERRDARELFEQHEALIRDYRAAIAQRNRAEDAAHAIEEQFEALKPERDVYIAALDEIANPRYGSPPSWKIARRALRASSAPVLGVTSTTSEASGEGNEPGPGAETSSPANSRIGATTYQWLVERGQPEGLSSAVWLEHSGEHPATHRKWTTNARESAMFPDRATAERYIADENLDARAVEHGFMSEPDPASEPESA